MNNIMFFLLHRSIGLHREADMIEQQLKMKQGSGQGMTMPSGMVLSKGINFFFWFENNLKIRFNS